MAATLLRLTGSWVTRVAGKGALQATDAASTQLRFFSKDMVGRAALRREPNPIRKAAESEARNAPMPSIVRQTLVKKRCPICTNQIEVDYKNVELLSQFVTDHSGMILPRTLTGVCAKQQRKLAKAIKRSRAVGLMPCTYKLERYKGVNPNFML